MRRRGKDHRRKLILMTASDAGLWFIAYNRKEDEELPLGAIEEAVERGEVTLDEIVAAFRFSLIDNGEWK